MRTMLVLDTHGGTLLFDRSATASSFEKHRPIKLLLTPEKIETLSFRTDTLFQLHLLKEALLSTPSQELLVSFGHCRDPFADYRELDLTLRTIEMIAAARPLSFSIQTRSPLVLLALPVLKSFRTLLNVTIALETNNNSLSRHYFPACSRPDERMQALQTLRSAEIHTTSQIAPFFSRGTSRRELLSFAQFIAEYSCEIQAYSTLGEICLASNRRLESNSSGPRKQLFLHTLQRLAPDRFRDLSECLAVQRITAAA